MTNRDIPIGVLFDWDGVIVDSSDAHEKSWERLAAEESLPLPRDHFRRGFGMKNELIIPELLHWTSVPAEITRLSLRKEELYREIVRTQGLQPLPGVRTWLDRLDDAALPYAIASSSHRENITTVLQTLGLEGRFPRMITSENVHRGKPDPEVFLLAAQSLKLPASRCVVFEDALPGIEAGLRAGAAVVAVSTTHPPADLTAADRIVARMDELTPDDLRRLLDRPDRGR